MNFKSFLTAATSLSDKPTVPFLGSMKELRNSPTPKAKPI
jgi:hypothetical protein